jgi:hypothetical protein
MSAGASAVPFSNDELSSLGIPRSEIVRMGFLNLSISIAAAARERCGNRPHSVLKVIVGDGSGICSLLVW